MLGLAQSPPPPNGPLEPIKTSVTVVEKIAAEAPASISVLGAPEIRRIPGINLDDRLRMVPGFSLFRRNSSLVAHPTTQGISLRGVGASGASRSLVLWDGVPINDPFGGWVYWTRVSPDELSRVEVSRGASTSVFGDRAMSGAIALFSREAEPHRLTAAYEFGNRNTNTAELGYSHLFRRVAISGNGRAFTTNGYYIVPERFRGAADTEAAVRFVAGDARVDFLGDRQRLFLKIDVLSEERANGTVVQRNSSGMGNLAAHYSRDWGNHGISALGYHTRAEFRSAFSAILAGRNSERPTFQQTVPAEAAGGAAYWRYSGAKFRTLVGTDLQRVEGYSNDRFAAFQRTAGGVQTQHGRFFQADAKAGPVQFFLGARHHVPGAGRQFFSPSFGMATGYKRVRARGTLYRSFRAPTLNELYRQFAAGNATTLANSNLAPERVFGAEIGIDYVGENNRATVTFFRNRLQDLVTNVTLSVTPTAITRQRQNAAEATTRGAEFEFRQRWRAWQAEVSYLFADSRFSTALRIPQIPRHQGSGQLIWTGKRTFAAFGVRSYGMQFDDDLNTFRLPGFAAAHATVRHQIYRGLSAVASIENLLDREYYVAFTPVPQNGAPRMWRAGLRWDGRLF
ncbi:MAG: TonB-dependent receptor [Bryobacteraceae bacterium]